MDGGFSLKDDMLRTLPIWVTLPQLPLHLWGASSLGKIGSVLGKTLFTDECTAHKLRVSYARILVEIDVTKKLVDSITIKDLKGKVLHKPVEYEWRPLFCESCQKVGHVCKVQNKAVQQKKMTKQWKVQADHRVGAEVQNVGSGIVNTIVSTVCNSQVATTPVATTPLVSNNTDR